MTAPKAASVREPQPPVDQDHSLRIGWVAGALLNAMALGAVTTTDVEVLDDEEGRHLDTLRIHAPSGTYLVSIEKEP